MDLKDLKRLAGINEFKGYRPYEGSNISITGNEKGAVKEGSTGDYSAKKARAAAANSDFEGFKEATGAGQYADELYKAVRAGMGIQESYWNSLGESISVSDKMDIIEELFTQKTLKESSNETVKDTFLSLDSLSDSLIKNKKYITVPLILVNNTPRLLDAPKICKFISKDSESLKFESDDGGIHTYPPKTIREISIFNTFTFLNHNNYDKFRNVMQLKFDLNLPTVMSKGIKEGCKYGRYYCSTDKKWKCRTGPKQKRSS